MIRHLLLPLALLTCLAGLTPAAAAAPQDSQAFGRLAQDQAQLAEQVRRLERLFETLEQREREQGSAAKAELLQQARLRLQGLDGTPDLATAVEAVAQSLTDMRSGDALETQAELIAELESLLDFLLQRHLEQQLESLLQAAAERVQKLQDMAARQRELLAQLQALRDANRSAEAQDAESSPESEEPSELEDSSESEAEGQTESQSQSQSEATPQDRAADRPPRDPDELADRQEQLSESMEDMLQKAEAGSAAQDLQQAQEQSQAAEQELREEDLSEAEQRMEEALEKLEQALQEAQEQLDQAQQREQLEDLINLLASAEALLAWHREVEGELVAFVEEIGDRRPNRRQQAKLRSWSAQQQELADDTAELLIEVDLGGADTFPFLLQLIADDHGRLGRDLGPRRYRAGLDQTELAAALTRRWTQLIEAIQTEMERVRQQFEQPGGGGEPQSEDQKDEQQLVAFTEELQLLKRVQEDLVGEFERSLRRREALAAAGLELDDDDLAEIDRLVERQGQLREIYDAMLSRLKEKEGGNAGEDA